LTQAIKLFDQAIAINPKDVIAYYNKGLSLQKLGDFIGAIENYNKALHLTPNNEDIIYNRNLAVYALRSIA